MVALQPWSKNQRFGPSPWGTLDPYIDWEGSVYQTEIDYQYDSEIIHATNHFGCSTVVFLIEKTGDLLPSRHTSNLPQSQVIAPELRGLESNAELWRRRWCYWCKQSSGIPGWPPTINHHLAAEIKLIGKTGTKWKKWKVYTLESWGSI